MPNKKILIAEDEPFLLEMIEADLMEHGFQVETVKDGEEAISSITTHVPDVLLLDLLMPRQDGYAVLRYMQEKGIQCKTVVLSNISDSAEQDKCFALGASAFLVKSALNYGELGDKLRDIIMA